MADFCTVDDVEELLQVEISDADQVASCERAITAATAAIRNYTRQYIERVVDDEITLDVGAPCWEIVLPEIPVISVSSVVEDDETLTAGRDEDYVLAQYGILRRMGQRWDAGPQILVVTYTHGYATIPDDIVDVCTRAAARMFQAGLRAAADDAVPGISGKSLGDFSVNYSSGAGGVGEGVMGVSASRALLLSEKDTLDYYKPGA
jgi:hypothetical protein